MYHVTVHVVRKNRERRLYLILHQPLSQACLFKQGVFLAKIPLALRYELVRGVGTRGVELPVGTRGTALGLLLASNRFGYLPSSSSTQQGDAEKRGVRKDAGRAARIGAFWGP